MTGAVLAELPLFFWGMVALLAGGLVLLVASIRDAARTAGSTTSYTKKAYNRWYVYAATVIGIALISEVMGNDVANVKAFRMPAESMLPTLEVGDCFMAKYVTDDSYENSRGDILVFKYPGDNRTDYVKRVVGFPNEQIEIKKGRLLVDGEVIYADWANYPESFSGKSTEFGPYIVPEGKLFILGDNLLNSADSRHWGLLPRGDLVGVARYIYFSWAPAKHSFRWGRIGASLSG